METERSKRLAELIDEVGGDLTDLVMWPESEPTREVAAASVKKLRKAFKEEGCPLVFQVLAVIHAASGMYRGTVCRTATHELHFKQAWLALAEALP